MGCCIHHVDFDYFYPQVEELYNAALRGIPHAVGGDVEARHGIILSANPQAKRFGVRTGDAIWQAREKCPAIVISPPHMYRYKEISDQAREILRDYACNIESCGLDESYYDMSGTDRLFGTGESAAREIKARIRNELGLTASIGVGFNRSMAKFGSDYRKPAGLTLITRENFREIVWPAPVSDLWYVGRATTGALACKGITTIGGLARTAPENLKRWFGVNGELLWQYANGIDNTPVMPDGWRYEIKSVGNSTTTPRDLLTVEDVRLTTTLLAESVAERMRTKCFKARTVQVWIRYSDLSGFQRQAPLPFPSGTAHQLGGQAMGLILRNWREGVPIRSLGVRACNLLIDDNPQMSLLPELREDHRQEALESVIQDIRRRYGHFSIQRGLMVADRGLSNLDTRAESSAQSIAFYRGKEASL